MQVVNPDTQTPLIDVPFAGHIMKGCSKGANLLVQDFNQPGTQRMVQNFSTKYSFGNFSSTSFQGVLSMAQNPTLEDSGYEIQLVPGQEFPKQQYWSMFGIFTVDLSSLNPAFSRFQLANRAESPIRLEVKLNKPWGDEPLLYTMMDEVVSLHAWDANNFDFSTTCPLTGGAPRPIAFIRKDADRTLMTASWRRVAGACHWRIARGAAHGH